MPPLQTSVQGYSRVAPAVRFLIRELKHYPATVAFCASWIAVFVAMLVVRQSEVPPLTWWRLFVLGIGDGHRFGDLTLDDLSHGEIWRLMTCNFVHYSILHIILNLFAFYLLGTLIEGWYGSPRLIFIYGVTGGLGNLVSAVIRQATGSSPAVHSGGGSVVIMGLVGLCAVVGWRERHSREGELRWQMLKALGLTALLGIAFPRYIDNWGHAGGALMGIPLGLADRRFLRNAARPSAWGAGMITSLVILSCGLAQAVADRREAPVRAELITRRDLADQEMAYRTLQAVRGLAGSRGDPRFVNRLVESLRAALDRGSTRASYQRLSVLTTAATSRELTAEERGELSLHIALLSGELRRALAAGLHDYWEQRSESRRPGRDQAIRRDRS